MVDEGLSVTLVSYNNDYMWTSNYEFNKAYTGKEVKEISLCDSGSFKNVLKDIIRLWKYNRDPPHTNLYYSFLRLSLAGLKTGNIKPIIFRGGILNLLFFTISFVFFFLLMKLLFSDSKSLQFLTTACAFLSTATISNTLLLRPYQIQETLFIIFCYCFIITFDQKKYVINENRLYINTKLFFSLSLITAFTLLTGYYSIIFIAPFGLYVIYIRIRQKNYAEIIFYMLVLCVGLTFAQSFYLRYLRGYFSLAPREAMHTLFGNILGNLKASISCAGTLLQGHFFTYPVIAICACCLVYILFRKQKLRFNLSILCFIVSIFYLIIILVLAPYKILRYVMPVFPFFVIPLAVIINSIEKRKVSIVIMLLLFAAFFKNTLSQNNIDHLYPNKRSNYYFAQDTAIPVFVLNSSPWKYADMVPYFNDEQIYYFNDRYENIKSMLRDHNEFYLVVEDELKISNPVQFKIEQEFTVSYFICKKIKAI
ncbi:MAG: hypothetical protein FWG13_03070 [Leptospirales bacterium]|nr:hypothetical protein [Leptospirales bacterium]